MSNRKPDGRLGIKGVYRKGPRFSAVFLMGRRKIYLGTYDTVEEAAAAQLKFITDRKPK